MSTNKLLYADITEKIIGTAFYVHKSLGEGLSEKTYQTAMAIRLRDLGLLVDEEKVLPVFFGKERAGEQRVDLLVENKVIVETKALHKLSDDHSKKLLACLRNTQYQLGLLITLDQALSSKGSYCQIRTGKFFLSFYECYPRTSA